VDKENIVNTFMLLADAVSQSDMAWLDYKSNEAKFRLASGKVVIYHDVDACAILDHLTGVCGWSGGGNSYGRKLVYKGGTVV